MIYKISRYCTNYLDRNGIINSEAHDIYLYGFDITIASIMNMIVILALGFIFRRPYDAIIYSLCTRPLRKYGGGWHASTHLICLILHSVTFSLVSWISYFCWTNISLEIICIIYFINILVIMKKAPVVHPDNPLSIDMQSKNRKKCMLFSIILFCVSIVTSILNIDKISVLITFSSFSAILTLLKSNKCRKEISDI